MSTKNEPDPVERLLDVAVYAPLGFLLSARDLLPEWTERGRRQLAAQLPMARTVGEIALRQGSKQARVTLARLRRQADEILADMRVEKDRSPAPAAEPEGPEEPPPGGMVAPPTTPLVDDEEDDPGPERPYGAGETGPERADGGGETGPERADGGGGEAMGWVAPGGAGPRSAELAIPGYDTLSASQVVQRLAGLSMEELEAVRTYELASRARKTVLLRVAQLRAAS